MKGKRIIMVTWKNSGVQQLYEYNVGKRHINSLLNGSPDNWVDVKEMLKTGSGVYEGHGFSVTWTKMDEAKLNSLKDHIQGYKWYKG